MNNTIFRYFLIRNIINKIKPFLWKRYDKKEFYRSSKNKKLEIYSWWFNVLTFVGIIFVLLLATGAMVAIPNLLYTFKKIISHTTVFTTDIYFVKQVALIPSFILGFTTGIFIVNSVSYFFYSKFIRYDLLHNMVNAKKSVESDKTEAEIQKEIQQTMDLQKIEKHDWLLLFRIWLIVLLIANLIYAGVVFF